MMMIIRSLVFVVVAVAVVVAAAGCDDARVLSVTTSRTRLYRGCDATNATAVVWQANARRVYGARVIGGGGGGSVLLHTALVDDGGGVEQLETYALETGAVTRVVPLDRRQDGREASSPSCATEDGASYWVIRAHALERYDRASGRRETVRFAGMGVPTHVACGSTTLVVVADDRRVLYAIDATDALAIRALARLPAAPTSLAVVADGVVYAALGRPTLGVWVVNVSSGGGTWLAALGNATAASLAVTVDQRTVVAVDWRTGETAELAARRSTVAPVVVAAMKQYTRRLHLLLDTHRGIRSGAVVDSSSGELLCPLDSALVNHGNLGACTSAARWLAPDRVWLVDAAGAVAAYNASTGALVAVATPIDAEARVLQLSLDAEAPWILWQRADGAVVVRRAIGDGDTERVLMPPSSPRVLSGGVSESTACVLVNTSSVAQCFSLLDDHSPAVVYTLARQSNATAILWDGGASAVVFDADDGGTGTWLDVDWWRVWFLHLSVNVSWWQWGWQHADQLDAHRAVIRVTADEALVVNVTSGRVLYRYVTQRNTNDSATAELLLFDPSTEWRDEPTPPGPSPPRASAFWRAVAVALLVVGSVGAAVCCTLTVCHARVHRFVWALCCGRRDAWRQMRAKRQRTVSDSWWVRTFCNRDAQSLVFSLLSLCSARLADRAYTAMQGTWAPPATDYVTSDRASLASNAATPSSRHHWEDVNL